MSASKPINTIMQNHATIHFLLLFLCHCFENSSIIGCIEIEKQALLSFKQSLQDPLNMLSSWNVEINCCEWKGVVCKNTTGHVLKLHLQGYDDLPFQGLSGKINPSLLNLTRLKYLDMSQNYFQQTVPSFIGSLASLEYLDLSRAGFYGKLPHDIRNLSNLQSLIFEEHTGSKLDVDSIEWLSGLSKLEYLNMNNVNLSKTGNWAQVISKLPSLVELHFSNCSLSDFTGSLNDVIINMTSNLATLDLSNNCFRSLASVRWILQHDNLVFLDLSRNSIEGPIPTVTNTTKLRHIDLYFNKFNSSIPEWLYLCKDLEFVYIEWNNLQGTISHSIANLTSLRTLDLSFNQISGNIPRDITNLCKMKTLDLSGNNFQGEISDSFGNMSGCFLRDLEFLSLSGNQLSGYLTHIFGEFKSLGALKLSRNSLSGVIPNDIGNLSSLEYLDLSTNKLSGNLPESIGQLLNLKELDFSDNMLQGVVTEAHFIHLSKLNYLHASRNHLTLKVGVNWIPPVKLEGLRLGSWNLGSGSKIPSWLETQKKSLLELDLSCTGISGNVPGWVWKINFLNLSHNQLYGKIPVIGRLKNSYSSWSRSVYLSSNKFSGPLPRIGSTLTELDLSNNSFSGNISHFLCDMTSSETNSLTILHLAGNELSGELPDCWMKWPSLTMLNLSNNNLSGRIPNSIGFLKNMESLNLYSNKFIGHIPFGMQKCTQLLKMDLSDNNLDGNIPIWIGTSLSGLKFLILRTNKFSGEITSSICQLSSLQILDLSDNKFSGIIHKCVDNFTAMATKRNLPDQYDDDRLDYSLYYRAFLESASIATKGSELHYDTILPLVTSIDLSRNNFSGDIPEELTSLVELKSLNLSGNRLTGSIPESIGNMKQLESLDFSINSLSGGIPSSFTIMTCLDYLNLSYNNLTGKVPESTQLQDFNESSFIGNNLCGPPLTSTCNINDGEAPKSTQTRYQDQEGDEVDIERYYAFVSLGYAVGLSGFLMIFLVKKSWREAYYEFLEETWDIVYVHFCINWRRLTRASGQKT